jgi:hypothetical protein
MKSPHVDGQARCGVASIVAGRQIFLYSIFMAGAISNTEKRTRGRPRVNPTSIHLTLLPDQLAAVDQWIDREADAPSRPKAIRRLVELGLTAPRAIPVIVATGDAQPAREASDMAGQQIDKLADSSATADERQTRKRRLLKGPKEFRDLRVDLPKPRGTSKREGAK